MSKSYYFCSGIVTKHIEANLTGKPTTETFKLAANFYVKAENLNEATKKLKEIGVAYIQSINKTELTEITKVAVAPKDFVGTGNATPSHSALGIVYEVTDNQGHNKYYFLDEDSEITDINFDFDAVSVTDYTHDVVVID